MITMNTNNKKSVLVIALVSLSLVFSSCQKDELPLFSRDVNKVENNNVKPLNTLPSYLTSQAEVSLLAGQHILSGTLSISSDASNLYVSYLTINGWTLEEVHFAIGKNKSSIPVNKGGNPIIGNFPYKASGLNGQTSYVFTIPHSNIDAGSLCDILLYYAGHAVVKKQNSDGSFQTETAWSDGIRFTQKGSWASYNTFTYQCLQNNPPDLVSSTETAFAYGNLTLIGNVPNANRWGWIITVDNIGSFSTPIYAAAGQNDISKGVYVGDLLYSYDGSVLNVSYQLFSGFWLEETHLYASSVFPTVSAPGLYGNSNELQNFEQSDSYSISVSGSEVYIIAHAVVASYQW